MGTEASYQSAMGLMNGVAIAAKVFSYIIGIFLISAFGYTVVRLFRDPTANSEEGFGA